MAAEGTLTEADRLRAGHAILSLTDEAGLAAPSAGWLRSEGTWRFFLTSPLVDEEGPAWVYRRLLNLFGARRLPAGLSPLDIMALSPTLERSLVGAPDVAFEDAAQAPRVGLSLRVDLPAAANAPAAELHFLRRRPRGRPAGTAHRFDRGVQQIAAREAMANPPEKPPPIDPTDGVRGEPPRPMPPRPSPPERE